MVQPVTVTYCETDIDALAGAEGRVAVLVPPEGKMDIAARRVNRLTKGALARLVEARAPEAKPGQTVTLAYPTGMAAEAVDVVFLPRNADVEAARKAGAALAKLRGKAALTLCAGIVPACGANPYGLGFARLWL